VAIESKLVEYLEPREAKFSPAYEHDIQDWRRYGVWFKEMMLLQDNTARYRFLDAAQLVKHAFGVARTFAAQRATLLYLFWEPSNHDGFSIFEEHKNEIMRFADAVRGAKPPFMAMPYSELWQAWERRNLPSWLSSHVARLRMRYIVEIKP
jgi:restriction endonuclease-like protein